MEISLRIACGSMLSTAFEITDDMEIGLKFSLMLSMSTVIARNQVCISFMRSSIRVWILSKRRSWSFVSWLDNSPDKAYRYCCTAASGDLSSWDTMAAKCSRSNSFSLRKACVSVTNFLFSNPRRVIKRNSSGVKGFGRKSNAPLCMASTAEPIVAYPVMTIVTIVGSIS